MDWLDFEMDERSFCYILYSKKKGELSARCYMADEVIEIKAFEKKLLSDIIKILPTLNTKNSKRKLYVIFSNKHAAFFGKKQDVLKTIEFTYSLYSDLGLMTKFVLSEKLKRLCKFLFIKERERLILKNESYYELGTLSECEEYDDEDSFSTKINILRRKDEHKLSDELLMQLDDPPNNAHKTPNVIMTNNEYSEEMKICDESHISFESIKISLFNECRMITKHSKSKYIIYKCVYFDYSPIVFYKSHVKLSEGSKTLRYNEDYYHSNVDYDLEKFIPTFDKNKLI